MNELSIEEKAKRYDEAIINGSRLWECGLITRETYEHIFPELEDSENNDEKIRKMLIAFVKNDCIIASDKYKQDTLTWLEKQNTNISSFPKDQQVFMRKYVSLDKITLIKLLAERDANNAEIIDEKQDEQKPNTIFLKFRIGDKVTNGDDTYTINYIGKDCYWVKEHDCATIPFEYQHNWKLVEQNYAWSEEDENVIKVLMNIIKKSEIIDPLIYTDSLKEKLYDWLKSIKERVQLQSKQEWKPSDEQMHYLSWIANIKLGDGIVEQVVSKHLNELYEDLKKLKRE